MSRWLIPALAIILVAAAAASLLAGTVWLTPGEVLSAFSHPAPNLAGLIVLEIRLPRTLLAILIGAVLGLSGAVLQGLLRNPLAEPGLLGVSAGASLGAVIAIYYGFSASFTLASPLFGLVGGLATAALALLLSRNGGTLAVILAGSAITSIAAAGTTLALNLAPNPYAAYEIMNWLMGSLAERSWDHVRLAAPFILVGGALLLSLGRSLDVLALGETQAESLGIAVGRVRLLALVGTALGVGAATAVAGAIGFVGLIAPHLVRPLVGYRPGKILVPATLVGAIMVVIADIATRLIRFGGPPINLGVFLSIVGAPFFLWLVVHVRRRTA
ncbi:iron complex transport system permease protein [Sphingomonas vulcanisoli]|uniref:Iron complex transport system permease protein n=1 Tax=Sphingomonas vulcanisoli TaxID=1658060 RepID=A0ABX0TSU4_9SPHN|nr:iron ABC transporter permease [Sphingomonas vulcanisoli]NIJ08587.1 iron complex transport system permease protein [Sphingomonas vulcanisoli]